MLMIMLFENEKYDTDYNDVDAHDVNDTDDYVNEKRRS